MSIFTRRLRTFELANLELHVAHACNLACASCSHYSNHSHAGTLSLDDASRWMSAWNKRLRPREFSLLGGEPALHPELPEFVTLARSFWPRANLRLVTNGLLLHRHPSLPEALARAGNARLCVSVHHSSPEYDELLAPARSLLASWVREFGINVIFNNSFDNWRHQYKGHGDAMLPFSDGDPRSSWDHCKARDCKQLHEGKLWKCAPLAYLPMQKEKFALGSEWDSYLRYEALDPACTDAELKRFLALEAEPYCAMCPAVPDHFEKPWPLKGRSA